MMKHATRVRHVPPFSCGPSTQPCRLVALPHYFMLTDKSHCFICLFVYFESVVLSCPQFSIFPHTDHVCGIQSRIPSNAPLSAVFALLSLCCFSFTRVSFTRVSPSRVTAALCNNCPRSTEYSVYSSSTHNIPHVVMEIARFFQLRQSSPLSPMQPSRHRPDAPMTYSPRTKSARNPARDIAWPSGH